LDNRGPSFKVTVLENGIDQPFLGHLVLEGDGEFHTQSVSGDGLGREKEWEQSTMGYILEDCLVFSLGSCLMELNTIQAMTDLDC